MKLQGVSFMSNMKLPSFCFFSKNPNLLRKKGDCLGTPEQHSEIRGYSVIPKKGYSDKATGRFYFNEKSTDQYFTSRELSVLKLLMIGYRSKKVSYLLKISKRTVDEHIENIKIKLNCHTSSEIVPSAFTMGLHHLTFDIIETGTRVFDRCLATAYAAAEEASDEDEDNDELPQASSPRI